MENVEEILLEHEQIKNPNSNEALKCLKSIKSILYWYYDCNFINSNCRKQKEFITIKQVLTAKTKKELAWDIAVKKNVDILEIKASIDKESMGNIKSALEYYNENYTLNDGMKLTKGEFNLLKEMVRDGQDTDN